jgi:hypothetical protein
MRRALIIMAVVLFALSAFPVFARGPAANYDKVECCRSGKGGGHRHGGYHGGSADNRNKGSGKNSGGSQGGEQEKTPEKRR